MSWPQEEMGSADFGDKRLNRRAHLALDQLWGKPTLSIPGACKGWAETMAAYRFFDNEKVTQEKVLLPHVKATWDRIRQHPVVLCLEDTTEVDYSTKKETKGLGPLTYQARQGLLLHPTLAVTPDRVPLGCLNAHFWARGPEFRGEERAQLWKMNIEEKESFRWIEGYRRLSDGASQAPRTQLIYIADRESDIYELFVEAQARQGAKAHLLIRALHDRKVLEGGKLWQEVEKAPVLGEVEFDVPKSDGEPSRHIVQTLQAARLKLKAPYRPDKKMPDVDVTVILAREKNPPAGTDPAEWMLLGTMPVETFEEAAEKLQWYLCRWQIEIFFRILKSGCQIQKLQLEHVDRLKPAIALYMIIAWRVLHLTMLGRKCPNLPCDVIFDAQEWKAVYMVTRHEEPPKQPPALNEMIEMVASFGGFLNRKGDGFPGPKTLWIGLQRIRDFTIALNAAAEVQSSRQKKRNKKL